MILDIKLNVNQETWDISMLKLLRNGDAQLGIILNYQPFPLYFRLRSYFFQLSQENVVYDFDLAVPNMSCPFVWWEVSSHIAAVL